MLANMQDLCPNPVVRPISNSAAHGVISPPPAATHPCHNFTRLILHMQCAVALQHFMQTTIMFPARYVKNACIQMVTTYVDSIILGIFYTRLSDDYATRLASWDYMEHSHIEYFKNDSMSSTGTISMSGVV